METVSVGGARRFGGGVPSMGGGSGRPAQNGAVGRVKPADPLKEYKPWIIAGVTLVAAVVLYIVWRQGQVKRLGKGKAVADDKVGMLESENHRLRSAMMHMSATPAAAPPGMGGPMAQMMGGSMMAPGSGFGAQPPPFSGRSGGGGGGGGGDMSFTNPNPMMPGGMGMPGGGGMGSMMAAGSPPPSSPFLPSEDPKATRL